MKFYLDRHLHFINQHEQLKVKYNTVSTLRLAIVTAFFICGYYALTAISNTVFIAILILCVCSFIYLMRIHTNLNKKINRAKALTDINNNEVLFLNNEQIPFNDGNEFIDFKHPYSYDLDIFGNKSLFHNINRTYTHKGNETLAGLLLNILPQNEILANQEAVDELAKMPEWRQEIMALGYQASDNNKLYNIVINWSRNKPIAIPGWVNVLSYLLPALVIGFLLAYIITGNNLMLTISGSLFPVNVMLIFGMVKFMHKEAGNSTEIYNILENYSKIIEEIEDADFKTEKLRALQKQLQSNDTKASSRIKHLSELFSRMDTTSNLFVMVLFNGFFLFHVHVLRALIKWKKANADNIDNWITVIGEIEALSSLGNVYYNNPDFIFPEINSEYKVKFENLAHPLINKSKRVGNDVDFNPQFIILTGSNMSGKSTFLRSLGINMVLAGIGAPVCASNATIHPLPVLVSMRLSDSLSDSESYFFAEIKRLKLIMDSLEGQRAFVLLDEILRGTNSDDKQSGTIAVIKKMINRQAIGAIATHDIEVCNTTYSYPESLSNQCFEVQIVNNELYFDYTLREGICKNKSATFLMDKMGVI